jgi:hypothetical protein
MEWERFTRMRGICGSFDLDQIGGPVSAALSAPKRARRRWRLGLAVLSFLGLSAAGVVAATYTFDCTDANYCGQYFDHIIQITTTTDSFEDVRKSATAMPWWGNSALAQGMAASLGYTGAGSNQVLFAYSYSGSRNDAQVSSYYGVSAGIAAPTTNSYDANRTYVTGFKDLGHNPEINGGALPTTVLLLASLFLLFRQRPRPPVESVSLKSRKRFQG